MDVRRLVGRLLAVLVIFGLVFGPLVTPAAAKRLAAVEMTDMIAMSGDMPCCPGGQKGNDCQDCPLAAMCMLNIAQVGPFPTNDIQISFQIRRLPLALDDSIADGLIGTPPDHPPRIST